MEAPICCDVFVMAEVTPTSFGSAFWVAVLMQGTMASLRPMPSSSRVRTYGMLPVPRHRAISGVAAPRRGGTVPTA